MRDVVRHLIEALEQGQEVILCQVVDTRGSTPQKAGAMMAVDALGRQVGTLGGGCVENEVKQGAIRQVGTRGARLQSYVLDHDYAWADGLICGGKMVIATEAIRGEEPLSYFRELWALLEAGDGLTQAVVLDSVRFPGIQLGTRFLFGPSGNLVSSLPETTLSMPIAEKLASVGDRLRPSAAGGIAYLPVTPRVRLVIVGAGHVGQAVANLAAGVDFDVWVIDDRSQYANRERFPDAEKIVVGPIEDVLRGLDVTASTYALIVTRGHGHDQEALFHLAPTSAAYVGLIGSRRKIKLIFESLREQGISESALGRVAAPVGLDIGSQTISEIAISIVAELIARRNLGPKGHAGRDEDRS